MTECLIWGAQLDNTSCVEQTKGGSRTFCTARQVLTHSPSCLQQDIMRGNQMVDSLFQGSQNTGTHVAIMSSEDYLSQAQRNFNNLEDGYYISPAFLDKVTPFTTSYFLVQCL